MALLLYLNMCWIYFSARTTKEDFRNISHSCGNGVKKGKGHQEFTLTRDAEGIKKTPDLQQKVEQSKHGPLLSRVGALMPF